MLQRSEAEKPILMPSMVLASQLLLQRSALFLPTSSSSRSTTKRSVCDVESTPKPFTVALRARQTKIRACISCPEALPQMEQVGSYEHLKTALSNSHAILLQLGLSATALLGHSFGVFRQSDVLLCLLRHICLYLPSCLRSLTS